MTCYYQFQRNMTTRTHPEWCKNRLADNGVSFYDFWHDFYVKNGGTKTYLEYCKEINWDMYWSKQSQLAFDEFYKLSS